MFRVEMTDDGWMGIDYGMCEWTRGEIDYLDLSRIDGRFVDWRDWGGRMSMT